MNTYFHHYNYRHLLRSGSDYAEWKQLKKPPSIAWWEAKYSEVYRQFQAAGLVVNGFSKAHTKIIEKVLNFKGELMRTYHGSL